MFDHEVNFNSLVADGQSRTGITMHPILADFLVCVLVRVQKLDNDISRPLTKHWYETCANAPSAIQKTEAEKTGDACLVLVSFMPRRVEQLEIRPGHYIQLGVTAYDAAASLSSNAGESELYRMACATYWQMVQVLQAGASQTF